MLMEAQPEWMYLTHFGRVGDLERLAADMTAGVDMLVRIAERHRASEYRTAAIESEMLEWLMDAARGHDVALADEELREVLEGDVKLNTQGLEFWLDHG